MRVRAKEDSGQALALLCVVLLLAGVGVVMLGRLGGAAVDRARATTAADAAALAGATEGSRDAAAAMAEANGALLVEFRKEGPLVEVVVDVDGRRARARAMKSD